MLIRKMILLAVLLNCNLSFAFASKLTDLKDQPVLITGPAVLNFWATWCAPCIKELPDLEALGKKLGADARVYLINFGETTKTIEAFRVKNPNLFGSHTTVLKDAKMSGLKVYGLKGVPTTVLLNKNGDSVESIQGMKDWGADEVVAEIKAKILP